MLTVLLVVIVLLAALLGYAATRPGTFHVQRTAIIQAPPEKIYPLIEDFHRWTEWSPYEKLDPAMKRTYTGAASGKGAVYTWDGNGKAGAGQMEITEAVPPSLVRIALDFTRPFRANNVTRFTLSPRDGGTEVVWAMDGTNAFITRVMGIFVNMDDLIGKDFVVGLANLKAVAER
ncbi:MAG: polyketide cyclase [Gemmatimonadetes bacterium]|nr:polyketide cyclase [Gemmatimonadota bacterium]